MELNKDGRENFIEKMRLEISDSIPVDESRLVYLNHFLEYDKIEIHELLFITFRIEPPNNSFNNKSALDIFNDFNNLIKINDDIKTSLDMNNNTKYIDKRFGLRRKSKYFSPKFLY
jgi:hypothetical protein